MVTLTHDRPNESLRHHNATSAARELTEEQHDRWTMTRKKTLRRKRCGSAGRLLISSLFIIGAIFKIIYYGGSLDSLALAGISDGGVVLPVAIALELIGGRNDRALGSGFPLASLGLSATSPAHRPAELGPLSRRQSGSGALEPRAGRELAAPHEPGRGRPERGSLGRPQVPSVDTPPRDRCRRRNFRAGSMLRGWSILPSPPRSSPIGSALPQRAPRSSATGSMVALPTPMTLSRRRGPRLERACPASKAAPPSAPGSTASRRGLA